MFSVYISNFTVEGCVLNMYTDDVIIHTSATSKDELEYRLQVYIDNRKYKDYVYGRC